MPRLTPKHNKSKLPSASSLKSYGLILLAGGLVLLAAGWLFKNNLALIVSVVPLLIGIALVVLVQQNKLPGQIRVVSLNIWHGAQGDKLADYLLSQVNKTDVFCFQESDGRDAELVFDRVFGGRDDFRMVTQDKASHGGLYYSLRTYVRNSLTIVGHSVAIDQLGDEGLALKVDLLAGQSPLSITSVHGAPYPGHKLDTKERIRQSELIIEANKGVGPHIICGDFNLDPDTESTSLFDVSRYQSLIEDYSIETTRNNLAWGRFPGNKQLFADYAFASPDLKITSFRVPNNQASDHLPLEIVADIS